MVVSVCRSRCLTWLGRAQRLRHYIEGGSGRQKGHVVVPWHPKKLASTSFYFGTSQSEPVLL